ncbi:uncharacterized protein PgNI_12094 [Pyricularia grisea]|uniref:Uncharacterized protein n=1 Tax=Pyricularia grisea TaxID=148305 RepID=A0A6P8AQD7_PYRGI|nr:uncharacterized protein PgNI_12094 [Pyricularia grisea]TLD04285.1 hypothetical protein PgNI_12094 [Pyricularia grisea]
MVTVINIVPLFLGAQINVITSNFSVKFSSNVRLYRWFGTAAILEGDKPIEPVNIYIFIFPG